MLRLLWSMWKHICRYTFYRVVVISVLPAPKSNMDLNMSSFLRIDQLRHTLLKLNMTTFAFILTFDIFGLNHSILQMLHLTFQIIFTEKSNTCQMDACSGNGSKQILWNGSCVKGGIPDWVHPFDLNPYFIVSFSSAYVKCDIKN